MAVRQGRDWQARRRRKRWVVPSKCALTPSGEPVVVSNARLVEYEDGSFQLFVGSEPVEVVKQVDENEFVYVEDNDPMGPVQRTFVGVGKVHATLNLRPSKQAVRLQADVAAHLKMLNKRKQKVMQTRQEGLVRCCCLHMHARRG